MSLLFPKARSLRSGSSRSGASRRSHSASILRLRVNETRANIAAREAEIQVQEETDALDEQIEEMRRAHNTEIERAKKLIAQKKLRAALEAERRKQEVYMQALQAEEDDSRRSILMLTPREPNSGKPCTQPIPQKQSSVMPSSQPELASTTTTNTSADKGIMNSLAAALRKTRLPQPEPAVFDGSSITYNRWHRNFSSWIDSQEFTSMEKMHYLERYTKGEAREAIKMAIWTYHLKKPTKKQRKHSSGGLGTNT
jgi:hypothetical protein